MTHDVQARNVNGMELREGDGNDGEGGREGDKMNVVWIVDSDKLPFYRAEVKLLVDLYYADLNTMITCHALAQAGFLCSLTGMISCRHIISSTTVLGNHSRGITRCSSGKLHKARAASGLPGVQREAGSSFETYRLVTSLRGVRASAQTPSL